MWNRPRALLAAGLLWVLAAAATSFAQTADDAPAEDFFDLVEVEIVNIDVWVTDKDGDPVQGLGRDDFLVKSDGRPVEITNFYAVSGGRPVEDRPVEARSGEARPAGDGVPAAGPEKRRAALELEPARPTGDAEVAPEHRLWLVLYVDNYNLHPIERNRVFPALRHFLGQGLRAGDRAMIVTYDRSLEVRQPFTSDPTLLRDALDAIEDDAGLATIRDRERFDALQRIDDADSLNAAMVFARNFAEEQKDAVEHTVRALERLIDSLAGLPGRKALVHVSSGVPMVAGEETFHAVAEVFGVTEPYSEIPRHDTSRSFERVSRYANAHRVAFYTVDAGGLRGMQFGNAEYGGFKTPHLRRTLDSVVPENLQSPLRLMALETGGQAIVNQNEILPALEKAAVDFRSFYSLGIPSAGVDVGRYHTIEVKLREPRKGVTLRHRAGYRSKPADTRVRDSLRSALLYAHQENPLGVTVRWGRPEPHGEDGNYLLPIQLHIPLSQVVLLPRPDRRHEASLRLYVSAVGEDGETSAVDTAPLGLRLAEEHVEAARQESLVHTHRLLLDPGLKKVGVAVTDLFGRETSIVTRTLQVGPVDPG